MPNDMKTTFLHSLSEEADPNHSNVLPVTDSMQKNP